MPVSIHAPAWGATAFALKAENQKAEFQSTHPRGVRHEYETFDDADDFVSIHAPAWGATGSRYVEYLRYLGFNPRTRVGCDPYMLRQYEIKLGFNPRTRVGCDQGEENPFASFPTFQSTHPRGVRLDKVRVKRGLIGVSIHAPAWGAT